MNCYTSLTVGFFFFTFMHFSSRSLMYLTRYDSAKINAPWYEKHDLRLAQTSPTRPAARVSAFKSTRRTRATFFFSRFHSPLSSLLLRLNFFSFSSLQRTTIIQQHLFVFFFFFVLIVHFFAVFSHSAQGARFLPKSSILIVKLFKGPWR